VHRKEIVVAKVLAGEDRVFKMKRPLMLDIRPEGKLDDDMVLFDKKMRSGERHT
jgi:hypothetical protein